MLLLLVLAGTGKSFILACILEEGGMSLCVQLFYLTKIVYYNQFLLELSMSMHVGKFSCDKI